MMQEVQALMGNYHCPCFKINCVLIVTKFVYNLLNVRGMARKILGYGCFHMGTNSM